MKLIFISDIHGSLKYTKLALKAFKEEQGTNLVILGDILYHGPRNSLPEDYNPQGVVEALNRINNKIIAVRGNCDAEVDQMLLNFPCLSDYALIFVAEKRIFITHGHIFNENNMPKLSEGDVIIHGHTHIPNSDMKNGIKIINPGSISNPKEGNPHSYGVLDGNIFTIKDFDCNIISTIEI